METRERTGRAHVFTARAVLTGEGDVLDRGGLLVARGCIVRVLRSRSAVARASIESGVKAIDLGDVVLAPGFVNAHSHLELSGLRGLLPRTGTFTEWIRALLRERSTVAAGSFAKDVRTGAELLLAGGTTCSGDIDSSGEVARALRGNGLRLRLYREVLDAGDPMRTASALSVIEKRADRRARTSRGLSPHAPYTVSEELFRELGRSARRSRQPLAIHWAETDEEVAWLERGEGPLSALLKHSPRKSGLESIASAGLLGPRTALIHGNRAARGEYQRVAASGAVLVHCPGTHAFFARERFDLAAWTKLGVPVALGTDSLASNEDLDMRREMRHFRNAHPELAPLRVWDMATRVAARALCFEGRAGELVPGAWADLAAHATTAVKAADVLEALTSGETRVAGVWIAGRPVSASIVAPARP